MIVSRNISYLAWPYDEGFVVTAMDWRVPRATVTVAVGNFSAPANGTSAHRGALAAGMLRLFPRSVHQSLFVFAVVLGHGGRWRRPRALRSTS